jgi:hypothetical protein
MSRAAVDFDDEPGVPPKEVDDVVEQWDIHLRLWEMTLTA